MAAKVKATNKTIVKNRDKKKEEENAITTTKETTEKNKLKDTKQARDWCFTVNNPKQTEEEFVTYIKSLNHLRYCVFQPEAGENTGTKHYQGYIEFTQPKRFSVIKNLFSETTIGVNAHIENRKGKRYQAREYCMADETRLGNKYYEVGTYIESGERSDLLDIMQDIEDGLTLYELSQKHGNKYIRCKDWAKEYRQSFLEKKYKNCFRDIKVVYIHGSAGCGKTSYIYKKHGYEDVYRTTNYDFGWIDDYNGESIIVFDEFRSSFKISEILDYLDGYPLRIRGRNYNRVACYTTVYIISNLPLYKQYENIQQNEYMTWNAFLRRITEVYNFDKSKEVPVNKKHALIRQIEIESSDDMLDDEIDFLYSLKD